MAGTSEFVLGDDWYENFTLFRKRPEAFLEKRKLTREAFCLDILKDLYHDHIDPQCKIHLLLLLQENSLLLIQDTTLIEQIVGSLFNLYHQNSDDKRLLKSQILISITTILLGWEDQDDCVFKLTLSLKAFLLEIIYGSSKDPLLTSTACKCLEEIEIFYPKILLPDLSSILTACEKHMSPVFQSYVTLLSLVAKQAAEKNSEHEASVIKNLSHQEITSAAHEEEIQNLYLVSYLLELIPLLANASAYRVLKNLIPVVQHAPELSANSFKLFVPGLSVSSDVPLFHLSFELLMTFDTELFSPQEKQKLLQQLMTSATHPCLSSAQRLLFLDWLKSFTMQENSLSKLLVSDLKCLLPSPFDGPITQEKKLYLLCRIIPSDVHENVTVEFLNESLSGLRKCALLPSGKKAAASFFRTLFVFFSFNKSEAMQNIVYKLLIDISKSSPHLSSFALNFLTCAKTQCSDRSFHKKTMSDLVDHVLSIPLKQFMSNLSHYLAVLYCAAENDASICKPRAMLKCLQALLKDPNFNKKDNWTLGNEILSICRTFLKQHDVQLFYYDFAEVLCLVMKNIADVDVKNRSKLYYSALTSLSKTKAQAMFNLQSLKNDGNKPLTTFVAGSGSNLQLAGSIHKLSRPVLQLERIQKNEEFQTLELENYENMVCENDILKVYQSSLLCHQPCLKIPLILKHTKDFKDNFSTIYGIVITTHSTPPCHDISKIEIPVLQEAKNSDKGSAVILQLTPKMPHPLKLQFKAEFTCSNCRSYTCDLPHLTLKFEDLYLPFPVPRSLHFDDVSWKQQLFDAMWESFITESMGVCETKFYQSVFRPDVQAEDLAAAINRNFKTFIISAQPSTFSIAMYVPPVYHILMKVGLANKSPFIHILVDNVSILPWINLSLQDLNREC